MKKITFALLVLVCVQACTKEKKSNLVISGNIQGLKEGTLFLQKIKNDTLLVNLDSLKIDGDAHFEFRTYLKEPQILFLNLNKIDGRKNNDVIKFFAEKGEMSIQTRLDNFQKGAIINGSKNQKKLEEYESIMTKFNERNSDLIQKYMDTSSTNDQQLFLDIQQRYKRLRRSKYLYTVNYALGHKNMEIAPYLAVAEIYNAKIQLLDTIYNSLTEDVRNSIYGIDLKELLEERRKLSKSSKKQ